MHCPFCRSTDTRVLDTGSPRTAPPSAAGAPAGLRASGSPPSSRCSSPWSSAPAPPSRSTARRRSPVSARPARAGRSPRTTWPASARQVEDALRATGWAEVPAHEVGLAILGPLRELDEVAYLRFASVYRASSRPTTSRPRSRCSAPSTRDGPRATAGSPAHRSDERPDTAASDALGPGHALAPRGRPRRRNAHEEVHESPSEVQDLPGRTRGKRPRPDHDAGQRRRPRQKENQHDGDGQRSQHSRGREGALGRRD